MYNAPPEGALRKLPGHLHNYHTNLLPEALIIPILLMGQYSLS